MVHIYVSITFLYIHVFFLSLFFSFLSYAPRLSSVLCAPRCSIILQKEMENNNVKSNQAKTIGILSQSTQQQQQQQAQQQQMHDTIDRALESSSYQHSSASSHSHPLENGAGGCRRIASMATDDTQSHMQNPKQNMPMDDGADDRTKAPPIDGNDDATIGKDAVANARSNNRKGDVYAVERSSSPATIGSSGQKVECGGNEDAVTSANNKKCNLISSDIRNNPFDGPNATTVENFSVITGATAYQSNLVSASTNPFRICSYCSRCNQLIEQCLCDTQTNNSIRKYSTKIDEVAERSAMVPQTPPSSPQAEQPTFSSEQPKALDVSSIKNISKPNHVTHTSTSCSSSSSNSSKVIASNATASENRLVSSRLAYLPPHIRNLPKTQSLDLNDEEMPSSLLAQQQSSFDHNRTIYPNVPFSPYGSPFGSPRVRRRPLRESRRISMERCGSFLQLNQYKLMDQIGQVSSPWQRNCQRMLFGLTLFVHSGFLWIGETCLFRRGFNALCHEDFVEAETLAKSWFDGPRTQKGCIAVGSSLQGNCRLEKGIKKFKEKKIFISELLSLSRSWITKTSWNWLKCWTIRWKILFTWCSSCCKTVKCLAYRRQSHWQRNVPGPFFAMHC